MNQNVGKEKGIMRKHRVLSFIALIPLGLLTLMVSGYPVRVGETEPLYRLTNSQNAEQTSNRITTQGKFSLALTAARVPGGSIWIKKCSSEEPVFHQDPVALPLREALESITHLDPRYRWQSDSGVINLVPFAGEPDLLKVRVRRYRVNADLNEALQQLLALPEIKEGTSRLGLKRNTVKLLVGPSPFYDSPSRISLDVSNVTLREALNALVRAHGRAIWEYRDIHCNGVAEFSIDFLAQ